MTDASFLQATRDAYDVLAADHADVVRWDPTLASKPVDRALLAVFAEWIRAGGGGPVADVGCGSGRVTRFLADLGLDVFGVDLSPGMIGLARGLYPDLRFEIGSMLALDIPAASLGGVVAYYSIIHVPWEHRSRVFLELHRVLAPGGQLLLAFQVGDDRHRRDQVDGVPIPPLEWYRQQPDDIATLLAGAGFDVRVRAVSEPEPDTEQLPQAYVLARKPAVTAVPPGITAAGVGPCGSTG
jgi:SAM-dependent methyltransferase